MLSFSTVFWIDASSAGTILQGLKGICLLPEAKSCMLDGSPESALHWIGSLKENYAMIFDNTDVLSSSELEGYFPPGQRGNILITSRNSTMQCLTSPENSLEVMEMEENEAISLLLKASCLGSSEVDSETEASKIVKELCCLPLAVDQAGAFIASGASTIGDYLDKYLHHREILLSHSEFTGASKYNKSVYGTWELSYKEIQKKAGSHDFHMARAADSALFLLKLFPFWHYEGISEEIFLYAATHKNQRVSHPHLLLAHSVLDRKLLSLDKDGTWDNFIFREGVRVLLSFCLIKKGTSDNVHSMHPLVHAWGIDRMTVDERQKCSLMAFATLSASLKDNKRQSYGFSRTLVTHVRKNMQYNNNYFDDAYEKFASLLTGQGYAREAKKLMIKVLHARNLVLGEEHPATIMAKANLASTCRNLGKQECTEAEKLEIEVLHARNKIFGEEHPATITAKANLAFTYGDLGKYAEAEKLEIEVLHARNKNYGEDHPDTIVAMGQLAVTYTSLGRFLEAEKLQIQVLVGKRKIFGEDHMLTMLAMGNLACIYGLLGKHTEAEELQILVLHARNKIYGEEHPATLTIKADLAFTYCNLGKYTESEKLLTQVLYARNKIFGGQHLDTIFVMENLAYTYRNLGKYTEAEKLDIQVLNTRNKILGEEHPNTIKAMGNLSLTYNCLGRYTEAEMLQIQVLHARNKIFGEQHPDTIEAMGNLASTYRSLENLTKAEKLEIHVLDARKKLLGEEHPDTILAMGNLASTYSNLGKYTRAEKLAIQVLDASSKILGGEHPNTMSAMRNLAAIQKAMNQSMHMSHAENKVINTSHRISVTQGMEEENVDNEVPHASNRVPEGDNSDTVEDLANLPSITNADDRITHSEKKGI